MQNNTPTPPSGGYDLMQWLQVVNGFLSTIGGWFKQRTPEEIAARNYERAKRKLDHEARGYREDYVIGKVEPEKFRELMEDISRRQKELSAEYDAD